MNSAPKALGQATAPFPAELPLLPSMIRYWDDFAETTRTLRDFPTTPLLEIRCDGKSSKWDLSALDSVQRTLVKHAFCSLLSGRDPSSVVSTMGRLFRLLKRIGSGLIDNLAWLPPNELRTLWDTQLYSYFDDTEQANSLKRVLHSFCAGRVGHWRPELRDYVSKLRAPKQDPYKAVRSGECFVPVEHQRLLYDFLDEFAAEAARDDSLDLPLLRAAAITSLIDQHAFRPGTVARIKQADVRSFATGALHVAALVIKKQDGTERRRITRRIKREWCPIFRAYARRRSELASWRDVPEDSFFRLTPSGVSLAVRRIMRTLTGEPWGPLDLRHTAAQRLVDAGASADQLAEFMTHASRQPGLVYYDLSPTQAHRVNQALAISPTYAGVAAVHRTKTIDKAALLGLPDDNQIGGTPHGIALTGIGSCSLGQSLCPKNPVLSCYGCRKFVAVRDADIHDHVVSSLRPVVLEFETASRGHEVSPAYTQLRRTLVSAQAVAQQIRQGGGE